MAVQLKVLVGVGPWCEFCKQRIRPIDAERQMTLHSVLQAFSRWPFFYGGDDTRPVDFKDNTIKWADRTLRLNCAYDYADSLIEHGAKGDRCCAKQARGYSEIGDMLKSGLANDYWILGDKPEILVHGIRYNIWFPTMNEFKMVSGDGVLKPPSFIQTVSERSAYKRAAAGGDMHCLKRPGRR